MRDCVQSMSTQSTLPACAEATAGSESDTNIMSTPIDRIITHNLSSQRRREKSARGTTGQGRAGGVLYRSARACIGGEILDAVDLNQRSSQTSSKRQLL